MANHPNRNKPAPETAITINVPSARINDLLFGHRTESWLHEISRADNSQTLPATVVYDKETDDEGDGSGRKDIYLHHVLVGLAAMARGNPYQFGQWLAENDDMTTCGVAWQFIIFGKEIYG